MVACVVRAPYHHTLTVLEQREDLLAHADLVCRYETAQDVVQDRACNDVWQVSSTVIINIDQ